MKNLLFILILFIVHQGLRAQDDYVAYLQTGYTECGTAPGPCDPYTAYIYYEDIDNDGLGNPNKQYVYSSNNRASNVVTGIIRDTNGIKYVANTLDCNDNIYNDYTRYYRDEDGDGFGRKWNPNLFHFVDGCNTVPSGYASNNLDCDDNNPNTAIGNLIWYRDADGDGYGNSTITKSQCWQPHGYVLNNEDCNDNDATITTDPIPWYADTDTDGFVDLNDFIMSCTQPAGYLRNDDLIDECPTIYGELDGCPEVEYNFSNKNYIYTRSFKEPYTQFELANVPEEDVIESISYFDGAGRTIQTNAINASPNQDDIITHYEYDDANGKQNKAFLPYSKNQQEGIFDNSALNNTLSYYNTIEYDYTTNPFAEIDREDSPLQRIKENAFPGEDWEMGQHTVRHDYTSNTSNSVHHFSTTFNSGENISSLVYNGYYPSGDLLVKITKNENWTSGNGNTTHVFYDQYGRMVLERKYDGNTSFDTYYIYDDLGNLIYVLSPKASETIVSGNALATNYQDILNNLGYQYIYDYKNRVIEKKVAGKGWEYIVYNRLNQPLLTQDANLRLQDKWLFTKYDDLGRISYTGIFHDVEQENRYQIQEHSDDLTFETFETHLDSPITIDGTTIYYSNNSFPNYGIDELLTISYYDDYNFDTEGILVPEKVKGVEIIDRPSKQITGFKERILGGNNWITSLSYYDQKLRPVYVATKRGVSEDHVLTEFDFENKAKTSEIIHNYLSQDQINIQNEFTYDHVNRPIANKQRTNKISYEVLLGVEKRGNTFTKTTSNGWTNSDIVLEDTLDGDGYMSFTFNEASVATMIGFSESNHGASYNVDYAMYVNSGRVYVYEYNGSSIQNKFNGNASNNGLFVPGDELSIRRTNGIISYYKNDSLLYTSTVMSHQPLKVDGSIYFTNKSILNLQLYENSQELISSIEYDELGQLKTKAVGGNIESNPLQEIDYDFNIRGWLTNINDPNNLGNDLFSLELKYNDPQYASSSQYNGNISQANWRTANIDNSLKKYHYYYDDLNRLASASDNTGDYEVEWINYDKNGNITSLARYGKYFNGTGFSNGDDDLVYTYNGNSLKSVKDWGDNNFGFNDRNTAGDDYEYDANGNMIKDLNKGIIEIKYNHLNLPTYIEINDADNEGEIWYSYTATGKKLRKYTGEYDVDDVYNETHYANGFIYFEAHNSNDTKLKFVNTNEGYAEPNSNNGFDYVYQYKDQVGNVRLTYSDKNYDGTINASTEIIEENNYYPFGMKHTRYNSVVSAQVNGVASKWKFNGVEFEEVAGLDFYEMDFRQYNPDIGRFTGIDPVTHFSYSTYSAFDNNPIFWSDPSGADAENYDYGGGDEQDCCPDYNGGSLDTVYINGNPNELAEVTIVNEENNGIDDSDEEGLDDFDYSGMPNYLKHDGDDWWYSEYDESLADYNREFNTNYSYDRSLGRGSALSQYTYRTIYKPQFDKLISDIHSSQKLVAGVTLAVPVVIIGGLHIGIVTLPTYAPSTLAVISNKTGMIGTQISTTANVAYYKANLLASSKLSAIATANAAALSQYPKYMTTSRTVRVDAVGESFKLAVGLFGKNPEIQSPLAPIIKFIYENRK